MDDNVYPRLVALRDGRLSMYALEEWPRVRMELQQYERDVAALREFAVRLLMTHEGRDEATARAIVASVKP